MRRRRRAHEGVAFEFYASRRHVYYSRAKRVREVKTVVRHPETSNYEEFGGTTSSKYKKKKINVFTLKPENELLLLPRSRSRIVRRHTLYVYNTSSYQYYYTAIKHGQCNLDGGVVTTFSEERLGLK